MAIFGSQPITTHVLSRNTHYVLKPERSELKTLARPLKAPGNRGDKEGWVVTQLEYTLHTDPNLFLPHFLLWTSEQEMLALFIVVLFQNFSPTQRGSGST